MKNEQDLEQELVPVGANSPRYRSDEAQDDGSGSEEYRNGRYWRTGDGYVLIEEMSDQHVLNARRHALRKAGEYMQQQAEVERRHEIMLLKFRQLHREAKRRGLLGRAETPEKLNVPVDE